MTDPRWTALKKATQDKLLDEWRDTNVAHDRWWEYVYEQKKEELEEIGITASDMYFSGFWSQGDGACIEGSVTDWTKVLTHLGKPARWASFADSNWTFSAKSMGRYCHARTLQGCEYIPEPENPYDEDEQPLQFHAWIAREKPPTENDLEALADDLLNLFIVNSDDLYKRLEEEHDGLTSDEAVIEMILANHSDDELKALNMEDEEDLEPEDFCAA